MISQEYGGLAQPANINGNRSRYHTVLQLLRGNKNPLYISSCFYSILNDRRPFSPYSQDILQSPASFPIPQDSSSHPAPRCNITGPPIAGSRFYQQIRSRRFSPPVPQRKKMITLPVGPQPGQAHETCSGMWPINPFLSFTLWMCSGSVVSGDEVGNSQPLTCGQSAFFVIGGNVIKLQWSF